ncbi:MAG: guanylate kinase [Bacteriovoracaceae bacterium]|nr:guanylate kinase [Bacteriovoracaceae bacterium]
MAIVLVAPSGAGKGTLIGKLLADFPQFKLSVSSTTRGAREGEEHGVHYFFLKKEEFKSKIEKGDFIEWALVHDNYYGTSRDLIDECVASGDVVLLDIDVQGTDNVKKLFGNDSYAIFVAPPSYEILEQRLRDRGTDEDEVIELRLKNARSEMKRKNDYDYLLVNDDLETAYAELKSVVEQAIKG